MPRWKGQLLCKTCWPPGRSCVAPNSRSPIAGAAFALRGQRFGIGNRRSQARGQAIAPPDDAQANAFFEAVRSLRLEVFLEYLQNGVHFDGRTLPVRGGKREQRQCVNAQVRRAPDDAPCRLGPRAVTFRAWQARAVAQRPLPSQMIATCSREPPSRVLRDPPEQMCCSMSMPAFSAANLTMYFTVQSRTEKILPLARRPDQRFHMIQVALQRPAPAAVSRYSVLGRRPSNDFVHTM